MRKTSVGTGPSETCYRRVVASAVAFALVAAGIAGHSDFAGGWVYQLTWFPLLAGADAALGIRQGKAPLLGRPRFGASLFLWSAPFWLLFEAANFRLANWYYVFLPRDALMRWGGTLLAFSTVLPALCLGSLWAAHLLASREPPVPVRPPTRSLRPAELRFVRATGVAFLALCLWKPAVFYPLVWGAVTLMLEPFNYRRSPERSLLNDVLVRRWRRIGCLLGGGAAVGLWWELINYVAPARWIYTVPGLETGKAFEMPLPGFLGFPILALDAFVAYQALVVAGLAVPGWHPVARTRDRATRSSRTRPTPRAPAACRITRAAAIPLVAGLCAAALWGIDRYTTDSLWPRVEGLRAVTPAVRERLGSAGVSSVGEVARRAPEEIARQAQLDAISAGAIVEVARLAMLRGLGSEHASALAAAGIESICALAGADPEKVSSAVRRADSRPHVGNPARIRVWQRAARRRCAEARP